MASSTPFRLNSTQTALAFVLPNRLHAEINSLRRIHDKSFRKWDPHINVIYPFVEPSRLSDAIAVLHDCLHTNQERKIRGNINEVGAFRHRKNATVFLEPSSEFEENLRELRRELTSALGCSEAEGTHDGVYRPHLTVGQAGLNGVAVDKLKEQAGKLVPLSLRVKSLVVLKREASGKMMVVEELRFGNTTGSDTTDEEEEMYHEDVVWRPCFSLDIENGWTNHPEITPSLSTVNEAPTKVWISSYNIMAEPLVTPFKDRFPLIIEALASAIARSPPGLRVLCLQEVNDESLPLLLSNPLIQKIFPFSSHSPTSLLASRRNLVTLASENFRHFTLQFTELHKSVLNIYFPGVNLQVSNVHLTSGLTDQSIAIKQGQMQTLTRFVLHNNNPIGKNIILAGDFNLTTSSRTIGTALSKGIVSQKTVNTIPQIIDKGIWEDAFTCCGDTYDSQVDIFPGEDGATFDRSTNPLAALSPGAQNKPVDESPQRYDRILLLRDGQIRAERFERFGFPNEDGECGSDHYGVCAAIRIGETDLDSKSSTAAEETIRKSSPKIDLVEDLTDVTPFLGPYLPSPANREQREEAINLLRKILIADNSPGDFVFDFLGSYLMDVYSPDSDVDVLVFGSADTSSFFDFAVAQLRSISSTSATGDDGVKGVHLVNSLVPIIEVVAMGIKFDLQYCQAPALLERYYRTDPHPLLSDLAFDASVLSRLAPSSLQSLNTYRDTAYIIKTVPDITAFRTAYRFISLFLKHRGLYSAKFGYLGGIHLSLMLNKVVKLLSIKSDSIGTAESQESYATPSPASIIRTFFTYYASFDWAEDLIRDPFSTTRSSRTTREPVFIQAIHVPSARPNVASSCSRLSAKTISSEFALAAARIANEDWQWCLRPKEIAVHDFLSYFGAFVRIALDVWDVDEIGGDIVREMVGCLESRITRLMVSLGRLDGIEGRAWPARFCLASGDAPEEKETQFKGYYLVGISADESNTDKKRLLSSKVLTVVREFERSMKETREFQSSNAWLEMDVFPRKKIVELDLVLDGRNWGRDAGGSSAPEPENEDQDEEAPVPEMLPSRTTRSPPSKKTGSTSLRPAQDIIARIKWDPQLRVEDFLIGYEDRFVGVKETDLGKWKSEQTDEEFIPMHRIVWVRKKGEDGVKVWDRRKKLDLLFGSGKGDGT